MMMQRRIWWIAVSSCLFFLTTSGRAQEQLPQQQQEPQFDYLLEIRRELGEVVDVTGFIDTDECYAALIDADEDGDRKVNSTEYVTVVKDLGPPGFLEGVETFGELPFRIKATFNALACLCNRAGGASDCCVGDNAHISNEGAASNETPTPEQSAYLFTVCLATIRSIEAVVDTVSPTFAPSDMPTGLEPTAFPSGAPTELVPVPSSFPSETPSTLAPSSTPTTVPSGAPSALPSTPGDTPAPTSTPSPTLSPRIPIIVLYVILVPNGNNVPLTPQEIADLEAALDILAPQVADETFNTKRRLRNRRRLEVLVELPTSVIGTFQTGMLLTLCV